MDALDALYERARTRMTRPEFEARVTERGDALGGLLDREAVATVLLGEMGLLAPESVRSASGEVALRGAVERVEPTRTFPRGDGSVGFVAELVLRTDAGPRVVVFWDDAVKEVRKLAPGARIEATALKERLRGGRAEYHATRATALRVQEP